MRANEKMIWQIMKPALDLTGMDNIRQYLYGVPNIPNKMAVEASCKITSVNFVGGGLYIGFRIAEEFLSSSTERRVRKLLGATLEDVLKACNMG